MDIEEFEFEINLALDTGDKEWFNELIENKKLRDENIHREIKEINETLKKERTASIIHKAIALNDLLNNCYYISTDEGVRMPANIDDLDDWVFVKVNKNDNTNANAKISKGEVINIEYLSDAEDYCYKLYYKGYFLGFEDSYSYYHDTFEKENKKLKDNNKLQSQVLKNNEDEILELYEVNDKLNNTNIELNNQIHKLNKKLNWWKFWKRK